MKTFQTLVCVLIIFHQVYCDCQSIYDFQCSNGNCIPLRMICNGIDDCLDGSDEANSSGVCPTCPSPNFACANGRCIYPALVCNRVDDCGDKSDEQDPVTGGCPSCAVGMFTCQNGRCTYPDSICDGYDNCFDMSDEINSTTSTCPDCPSGSLACGVSVSGFDRRKCVSPWWMCDGITDCENEIDEKYCKCPSLSQKLPEQEKWRQSRKK